MERIKAGNEKHDYQAAVDAVFMLTIKSDRPTINAAISEMERTLSEAILSFDEREAIFARLNALAFHLKGPQVKNNVATYISDKIGNAITNIRNNSNIARRKKSRQNAIEDILSKPRLKTK